MSRPSSALSSNPVTRSALARTWLTSHYASFLANYPTAQIIGHHCGVVGCAVRIKTSDPEEAYDHWHMLHLDRITFSISGEGEISGKTREEVNEGAGEKEEKGKKVQVQVGGSRKRNVVKQKDMVRRCTD